MAIQRIAVWDEVDEFLISTPTPEQILAFRPSGKTQQRLQILLEANKEGHLNRANMPNLTNIWRSKISCAV